MATQEEYLALFDQLDTTFEEERVYATPRQTSLLHMNGVVPSQLSEGFKNQAKLQRFVTETSERAKEFLAQHGSYPAAGKYSMPTTSPTFKEARTPSIWYDEVCRNVNTTTCGNPMSISEFRGWTHTNG
jgi:hypothetical protein